MRLALKILSRIQFLRLGPVPPPYRVIYVDVEAIVVIIASPSLSNLGAVVELVFSAVIEYCSSIASVLISTVIDSYAVTADL